MSINSLKIRGLRGFSKGRTLNFAQPSGEIGSGLTIMIGPNSGGKSTVIEALREFSGADSQISFTEHQRNKKSGDRVSIHLKLDTNEKRVIQTVDSGGSEAIRDPNTSLPHNLFVLPSRRYFNPYFGGRGQGKRENYVQIAGNSQSRGTPINQFSNRLFEALGNDEFKSVLAQIMGQPLNWTIDQSDQGQYYLKSQIDNSTNYHNSEGLGEGIVSLLFIVDALYDSKPGEMIVIDEPELSLHPAYQRRLARLFANYSKDRQVVYATHSPYFVGFEYILNGAEIARVHRHGGGSIISQLSRPTAEQLNGFLTDNYNPHVLGLEACEAFFRDDGVVLVEGQEDVVYYPHVLEQLANNKLLSDRCVSELKERFFGWGAGGADKIKTIAEILSDLGFGRVAAVFDKNKSHLIPELKRKFPKYCFVSIEKDDVRTKTEKSIIGLLDDNNKIRPECIEKTGNLFNEVSEYILKGII